MAPTKRKAGEAEFLALRRELGECARSRAALLDQVAELEQERDFLLDSVKFWKKETAHWQDKAQALLAGRES